MSTYEFVCDDELIYDTLSRVFGHNNFRQNQYEVIKACLERKDVLAIMPTGSGKSLCYQLPAVLSSKITFIISPLLSLMEDQLCKLRDLKIPCAQINSTVESNDIDRLLTKLLGDEFSSPDTPRIIYTTPESLEQRPNVMLAVNTLVSMNRIDRFVVDEVHCLSQWGHDFRESYLYLQILRQLYPQIPCTALTASATEMVKKDILHLLGLGNKFPSTIITQSFFRSNLHIHVKERIDSGKDHVSDVIRKSHRGQCGIVYCLSRKKTEETATVLKGLGVPAAYYHAGMSSEMRNLVQKKWQLGELDVIVATIAFGMGIDKANVRFVIHQEMPHSIAEYYQEIGRAGRDGNDSDCYLFYSISDKIILDKMMQRSPQKKLLLHDMMNFIENDFMCRHRNICCEFEEFLDKDCGLSCDVCLRGLKQTINITNHTNIICRTILELNQNTTIGFVSQVIRNKYKAKGIDESIGKLEHLSNKQLHHLIQFLIVQKYIHTKVERNLKTGEWEQCLSVYSKFKNGDIILMPTTNIEAFSEIAENLQCPFDITENPKIEQNPLYNRLQRERVILSKRNNVSQLYRIASNKSLNDMVKLLPLTITELLKCQGIGKERAKKYGTNFIRIIKDFKKKNQIPIVQPVQPVQTVQENNKCGSIFDMLLEPLDSIQNVLIE